MPTSPKAEPFPWEIGVFDAHCHPTDTMSSVAHIPSMKTRALTVMATRSQDQELVSDAASTYGVKSADPKKWSRGECMLPSFGWHPWFSYQMYVDDDVDEGRKEENQAQDTNGNNTRKEEPQPLTGEAKIHHYQSVLRPSHSPPSKEHLSIYNSLPDPKPFSTFLSQTRHYLQIHPYALIGEIGLDRQFRIPEAWAPASEEQERDKDLTPGGREGRRLTPFRVDMCHQKRILKAQLRLAAEMNRAVSIHGVQAHGAVFEILRESWKGHEKPTLSKRERKRRGTDHPSVMQNNDSVNGNGTERETRKPYPPRICLHSYSGNPDAFGQFLDPKIPVQIFASFSTAINLSDNLASNAASEDDAAKYEEFAKMIKTVPEHMLLVESDLHTAGQAMDERMEDIVRRICEIKGWALEEGVRILKRNWIRFVFGDDGEEAKLEGCPDDRKTETL